MIAHDLSRAALEQMTRADLASCEEEPTSPIGTFEFHNCVCGIGSFVGSPPWEFHGGGDELLHVLDGECELTIDDHGSITTHSLRPGNLVVVPNGCWHMNRAPVGVTMLYMTPKEGNRHSWDRPTETERGAQ